MSMEQKSRRIGIGSVGLGNISKGVHLPGIERSPDLKLVALCDIDPKALKEAQEKYNIPDSTALPTIRILLTVRMLKLWIYPHPTTAILKLPMLRLWQVNPMPWKSQ